MKSLNDDTRSSPNPWVYILSQYPAAKVLLGTQIEIDSSITPKSKSSIIQVLNLESKMIALHCKMSEC